MPSIEKNKIFLNSIIPGLFIVGYVVGTGSVTSMVVPRSRYIPDLMDEVLKKGITKMRCGLCWGKINLNSLK